MNFLAKLPHDKALHLIGGVLLFAVGNLFLGWQLGLGLAVFVGLAKELWDWYSKKGTPDLMDFVATAAGGVLGFVCGLTLSL